MSSAVLDRFLEPLTECFTDEVADRIVRLRPDPTLQQRIDELAAKANEGELSAEESSEYAEYIEASDLLGLFKAKARAQLLRQE
ncbi:MAG: hypothetical protein ACKV2Q_21580 [Planctomycetaceae bacterium]